MKKFILGVMLLAVAVYLAFPEQVQHRYERYVDIDRPAPPSVVRMYVHETGEIINLSMEDYLVGVVAAEMPADFHPEALKAQALAARTYILKRLAAGGVANNPHPDADTCNDPAHAQGWYAREQLRERWGRIQYYRHYYKIKKAVQDTEGLVLTYNGALIDPVYHSACGGETQNSEDVWQVAAPYLRGVTCPYDHDPYPGEERRFSLEEMDRALDTDLAAVAVSTGSGPAIEILEYTSTGRPKELSLGGRAVPAATLRNRLGLRSTDFTFAYENGAVVFTTHGYGHGVGMCQWGANGLAQHGYAVEDIIAHYYTGVEVSSW